MLGYVKHMHAYKCSNQPSIVGAQVLEWNIKAHGMLNVLCFAALIIIISSFYDLPTICGNFSFKTHTYTYDLQYAIIHIAHVAMCTVRRPWSMHALAVRATTFSRWEGDWKKELRKLLCTPDLSCVSHTSIAHILIHMYTVLFSKHNIILLLTSLVFHVTPMHTLFRFAYTTTKYMCTPPDLSCVSHCTHLNTLFRFAYTTTSLVFLSDLSCVLTPFFPSSLPLPLLPLSLPSSLCPSLPPLSILLVSKKYPAAHGPPVDKRCDQCSSTFKVHVRVSLLVSIRCIHLIIVLVTVCCICKDNYTLLLTNNFNTYYHYICAS